jgi:phosphoglycolate phosphatase-like HAD superfamily hydrolase
MNFKDIKAIAWDLDGTMIDSFHIFEKTLSGILSRHRLAMPSSSKIAENYHGDLSDAIKNSIGLADDKLVVEIVEDFFEEEKKYFDADITMHLFNDAIELAHKASEKDLFQIIISNRASRGSKNASPDGIVARTVLANYINESRAGDQFDYRKPDPRIISDWLERLHIKPSELLVIGDQDVDAQLAINLGSSAVLIKRHDFVKLKSTLVGSKDNIHIVASLDEVELV